ncbi:MAG: hypothetical protein KBI47_17575 [Armatimonadetes bacterium]|jgi:DnaJ-class molecular chaperone|nr:hypothetical protein [Armatimonadota bacterium]MDI9583575.1 hypothetical protein [Acidobacteriota bacterium]
MARKLVDCPHCGGKKNCTKSGGRGCKACMQAAGMGRGAWSAVRCSYCGGRGKIWEEPEEEKAAEAEPTAKEVSDEEVAEKPEQ